MALVDHRGPLVSRDSPGNRVILDTPVSLDIRVKLVPVGIVVSRVPVGIRDSVDSVDNLGLWVLLD